MNRLTLGLIVSFLAHALVLISSDASRRQDARLNVKRGDSSVDMVYAAAMQPARQVEKNSDSREKAGSAAQNRQDEPEPDESQNESPDEQKPDETKSSNEVSETTTSEPAKETTADTATESKPTKRDNRAERSTKHSAPSAVRDSGAKWVENPEYRENPPPDYPTRARVQRQEGSVRLRVEIGPDGSPQSVTVRESSGHPLLDQSARETVRNWEFVPAKDDGEPVRSMTVVPVAFSLN